MGVTKSTGQSQSGGSGCSASASSLTYDANGNVASRTDFNGVVTKYNYDLTKNLETQRVEAYGKPEARTTNTQWHSYWRLPVQIAEPLKRTSYVYNGDTLNGAVATCAPASATVPNIAGGTQPIGVLCQKTEQATTDTTGAQGFTAAAVGTPRTTTWTYNQYGQPLTADGPRSDVHDVATYSYYPATDPDLGKRGNLASTTNALGQTTQITAYDLNGRPTAIVDPNGITTTLAYDARGRLTSRSIGGETTAYTYDPVGQLTHVSLPDGASLSYTYDPAHRLVGVSDGVGNRIAYTLDAMGNRTKEDTYDPANLLAQTRTRVFDALNRLYNDIGTQNQTTTYAYDANGNRTRITDPLNHVTINQYDPLNRLIRITDPGNGNTQLSYSALDQLTQVTDPRNLVTAYILDGLGNLLQQQSPDSGAATQTYDAAGNLNTRTDAKGQTTTYQYDALNRPTQISFADGSRQTYTWDLGPNGIGRLTQIAEQNSTGQDTARTEYRYDPQGRITQETRTIGGLPYLTAYTYTGGRLASMTTPTGRRIQYTRDAAGRITQITTTPPGGQAQIVVSQVTYQPFGGVQSFTYGNGQHYTRSLDQDGRITAYSQGATTQTLNYDPASRITALTDPANPANTASYTYDSQDRITSAVLPTANYGYSYDPSGNRSTQTIGATSIPYSISPASNRIQSIGGSPPRSLNYDPNGALVNDGNAQYSYDARGRLGQASTAQGATNYQINAQGERIKKSTATTDRLYHYDQQGRLIAEGGAQGQIDREYLYLDELPVAVIVE
ncbi:MAG: RHS repeat protein [Betaproteobacteria bacterium]|nr:RHS repeat protein [Betaproteobacteria bacterium]